MGSSAFFKSPQLEHATCGCAAVEPELSPYRADPCGWWSVSHSCPRFSGMQLPGQPVVAGKHRLGRNGAAPPSPTSGASSHGEGCLRALPASRANGPWHHGSFGGILTPRTRCCAALPAVQDVVDCDGIQSSVSNQCLREGKYARPPLLQQPARFSQGLLGVNVAGRAASQLQRWVHVSFLPSKGDREW